MQTASSWALKLINAEADRSWQQVGKVWSYLLSDLMCELLHPCSTASGGEVVVDSSLAVQRCMPQNCFALMQAPVGKHMHACHEHKLSSMHMSVHVADRF